MPLDLAPNQLKIHGKFDMNNSVLKYISLDVVTLTALVFLEEGALSKEGICCRI
jgi:hypothetical protein